MAFWTNKMNMSCLTQNLHRIQVSNSASFRNVDSRAPWHEARQLGLNCGLLKSTWVLPTPHHQWKCSYCRLLFSSRLVCFFPESTWESYFRVKTKVADRYAYMTLVKVNWIRTNLYDDDNVFAVPQRPPKPSSDIKRPPPRPQEGVVNLPPQKTNKVKNLSSMFGGQVCVFLVSQQSTKIMRSCETRQL